MNQSVILYPLWLLLSACTSLGAPDPEVLTRTDFGPPEELRICVLLDEPKITQQLAEPIIASIQNELGKYDIKVTVPWYHSWHRPAGANMAIIEALAGEELAPPCDRLLALVDRNFGDFLVGLLVIDELGAVDTVTSTRGYLGANLNSPAQIFNPPDVTAVHEAYHLLGCKHGVSMADCYSRIDRLKEAAAINRVKGNDFFPTYSRSGQLLQNREDVDVREAIALKVEQSKRTP